MQADAKRYHQRPRLEVRRILMLFWLRALLTVTISVLSAPALLGADRLQSMVPADSREPTPDEVYSLELMNRFRVDPQGEYQRITAQPPSIRWWKNVDRALLERELMALAPVSILVFDLAAIEAARRHSHYNVLNGQGHTESKGKPGFTGVEFEHRLAAA